MGAKENEKEQVVDPLSHLTPSPQFQEGTDSWTYVDSMVFS
jgi:hypothetical protein